MPQQEYLDLFDENDTLMRSHMTFEEAYAQKGYFLRSSQLFIVDGQWRLWIPRRLWNKKKFPWALDFSAGGHSQSGESYIACIIREAREEIFLELDPNQLRLIHQIHNERDSVTWIGFHAHIYEYRYDGEIVCNPQDFSEAFKLSPAELKSRLLSPNEPSTKKGILATLEAYYLK